MDTSEPQSKRSRCLGKAFRFLAPQALADTIVGHNHGGIEVMRSILKVDVHVTERGKCYLGTDSQIVTLQAATFEALKAGGSHVMQQLKECSKSSSSGSEATCSEVKGELSLQVLIPEACSEELAAEGFDPKEVQVESEPRGKGPAADRLITVSGLYASVEEILTKLMALVQEFSGCDWFADWALQDALFSSSSASSAVPASDFKGASKNEPDPPGMNLVLEALQALGPETEMLLSNRDDFLISCSVPSQMVGGLSDAADNIMNTTGARLSAPDATNPKTRLVDIEGSLLSCCAGYLLTMKRYAEVEAAAQGR
eukprot:TRINITY_DN20643_c0_g1_i1.p1 TRINITY_DN20643_c0_g1~~TRINITY_DN20643_c0_g1_i1.p1  ORF type:complete len:313 (-),score=71.56 TRINITY_DN20643_c0_g1_i1:42-980(-)